ncbi:sensor histidine kinase [Microbacterium sp. gxy059]|uniref:sensor histidine kinase n=1 Tax=Microbacterium sp. gxy059 TaxID=2957199 RepID=UPI003D9805A8
MTLSPAPELDRPRAAVPGPAELALPRPPGVIRRWLDAHPRGVDIALAALTAVAPGALFLIVSIAVDDPWSLPLALASIVVLAALTLLRRRLPTTFLAVALAVSLLPGAAGPAGGLSSWVALYTLGVVTTARRTWIAGGVSAAVWFVDSFFDMEGALEITSPVGAEPRWWWLALTSLVTAVFLAALPTLIGLWVGGRRRYERALIARAEDLARERDQRARLAVSEERTRIAREMHDIVSHSLTVMITLSEGAAAQAETGSDRAPDAMRRVAETGRESLAEMRRLLGVLRDPAADVDLAPLPGGADLDGLVERFRQAGMPVVRRHEGAPIPGGGIALTVFRIVQEGLTNVLRHAPGSRHVVVATRCEGDRVDIDIENGMTLDPATALDGRGLVGIRERAALHGGSVRAGREGDRWALRVRLGPGDEAAAG